MSCCGPVIVPPAPEPQRVETRLAAQQVANPAGTSQATSVDVQARVAAQGGVLQSVWINGGPALATNGCSTNMLALTTGDGAAWIRNGRDLRLEAADPAVGIVGPVVVGACGPGGQGDVFWTYTVTP